MTISSIYKKNKSHNFLVKLNIWQARPLPLTAGCLRLRNQFHAFTMRIYYQNTYTYKRIYFIRFSISNAPKSVDAAVGQQRALLISKAFAGARSQVSALASICIALTERATKSMLPKLRKKIFAKNVATHA